MTGVFDRTTTDLHSLVESRVAVDDHRLAQAAVNTALGVLADIRRGGVFHPQRGNHELNTKLTVATKDGNAYLELAMEREADRLRVSVHVTNATGHSLSLRLPLSGLLYVNQSRETESPSKPPLFTELELTGGDVLMRFTTPLYS